MDRQSTGERSVRRSRPRYAPADVFRLVLSVPVLWPGRTIRLDRDSLVDPGGRPTSTQVSVAELYHENSKLSPELLRELGCTAVDATALRAEYRRRRAILATPSTPPGDDSVVEAWVGMEPWGAVLARAGAVEPDLLYALEVRLVVDGSMYACEPTLAADPDQPGVWRARVAKRFTAAERTRLSAAVGLVGPAAQADRPGAAVVLLVGHFSRNEILFGRRGYRRTLLEAGRLAGEIARQAGLAGRTARVRYEFGDWDVDLLTEVDGVERGVVVAIELG